MSGPQTDSSGQIVKKSGGNGVAKVDKAEAQLVDLLPRFQGDFERVLPKHLTPERFVRLAVSAVRANPELAKSTAASFMSCLLQCAQMGLEPNTPLDMAYLIPRKNGKRSQDESRRLGRPVTVIDCTLQVGYKGYLQLARNANVHIVAYAVREDDEFEYELGLNPTLRHKPSKAADRYKRPFTHAYAVAKSPDFPDIPVFIVLTREEVLARKAVGGGGPAWSGVGEERMWQKTAVRALVAWVPKSVEKLQIAAALDDASEGARSLASAIDASVSEDMHKHGMEFPVEADADNGAIDTTAEPALTAGEPVREQELAAAVAGRNQEQRAVVFGPKYGAAMRGKTFESGSAEQRQAYIDALDAGLAERHNADLQRHRDECSELHLQLIAEAQMEAQNGQ